MAKLSTYNRNKRNITRLNKKLDRANINMASGDAEFWRKEAVFIDRQIEALTYKCPGEAHKNPAGIDMCTTCAPLWGRCVRAFTDDELCAVLQHATSEPFTEESYPYGSMEYHAVNEARALGYLTDEFSDMDPSVNVTFFFLNDRGRDLVFKWRAARAAQHKVRSA